MSFTVTVKWGKEKFSDVELNTTEPPEVFKAQLFALTNVPPERQKIMSKGSTLKASWDGFSSKLKKGAIILLMGSADPLPEAPVEKTTFAEDMTEGELLKADKIPPGLQNLGNTCYLNSVIQCLRVIPEIGEGFAKLDQNTDPLLTSMKMLWQMMDNSGDAQNPMFLVALLHQTFPQFAERDPKGALKQQDANEAWLSLAQYLNMMKGQKNNTSLISELMGIKFKTVTKIAEEGVEEAPKEETSEELSLSCFINQEVKYLLTGVKNKLKEEIEKNCESLSRNAKYERVSTATRLPKYVAINLIRFFYKQDKQVSAKVLKDVKFPESFDLWDICDQELKEKLKPMREKLKEVQDKEMELKAKKKKNGGKPPKINYTKWEPTDLGDDFGSNNSAWYNLKGVLTHKGRSIDAGHYIGWTKQGDNWVKCDDDKVTPVKEEEILDLSGGGDWHTAYILLYEATKVPIITADLEEMDTT